MIFSAFAVFFPITKSQRISVLAVEIAQATPVQTASTTTPSFSFKKTSISSMQFVEEEWAKYTPSHPGHVCAADSSSDP
jgi:hypothetical protein